jgi:hypothetical protein
VHRRDDQGLAALALGHPERARGPPCQDDLFDRPSGDFAADAIFTRTAERLLPQTCGKGRLRRRLLAESGML